MLDLILNNLQESQITDSVNAFNETMSNLGFSPDSSPIHLEKEKDTAIQLNYLLEDGSAMGVYFYIVLWRNKKSYVYHTFMQDYLTQNPNMEENIKNHTKHIHYEEKTRMGGIGWEVVYTKQPSEFTLTERKKILFDIFMRGMQYLTKGATNHNFEYKPNPGDILISRPLGPKLNQGFTDESLNLGTKQRGLIAQRYGFSEVYDNDLQYARYNNDLKLEPT